MRIGYNTANKCPCPKATSFQRDLTLDELEGLKKNNANIANNVIFKIGNGTIKKADLSESVIKFFSESTNDGIKYIFSLLDNYAHIKK